MTSHNFVKTQSLDTTTVFRRMLICWIIGLAVISFFIFGVDQPHPEWRDYWRIRPLIITPLATAMGALLFNAADVIRPTNDWARILVWFGSFLGFVVALWLGIVLGLDGTMWN